MRNIVNFGTRLSFRLYFSKFSSEADSVISAARKIMRQGTERLEFHPIFQSFFQKISGVPLTTEFPGSIIDENKRQGERKMAEDLTQWEYKMAPAGMKEQELNSLGDKGWETSGVINGMNGHSTIILMKRPKQSQQGYSR